MDFYMTSLKQGEENLENDDVIHLVFVINQE